jgi:hypothetical protein
MSIVKLLRLKRAAYQLAYRDEMIVNIALANGYESHEAFSRAFKKKFNKSPSDFRRTPDWTPWHSQYEPILKLRTKIMSDNVNFDTKVIDFPKTLIATMEHREAPSLLGNTIKKFIEHRRENPVIFSRWDESIKLTLLLNVFSGCFGRRVTNSCFRYLTTRIKCRAIKYLQCELV